MKGIWFSHIVQNRKKGMEDFRVNASEWKKYVEKVKGNTEKKYEWETEDRAFYQ